MWSNIDGQGDQIRITPNLRSRGGGGSGVSSDDNGTIIIAASAGGAALLIATLIGLVLGLRRHKQKDHSVRSVHPPIGLTVADPTTTPAVRDAPPVSEV